MKVRRHHPVMGISTALYGQLISFFVFDCTRVFEQTTTFTLGWSFMGANKSGLPENPSKIELFRIPVGGRHCTSGDGRR